MGPGPGSGQGVRSSEEAAQIPEVLQGEFLQRGQSDALHRAHHLGLCDVLPLVWRHVQKVLEQTDTRSHPLVLTHCRPSRSEEEEEEDPLGARPTAC